MSPEKEKKEVKKEEDDDRVLLCPEEWTDPECRKVVGEYHKGLSDETSGIDADMKAFENIWTAKGRSKVDSEYHKEGAPFMGWSEDGDRPMPPSSRTPEEYQRIMKERGVSEREPGEGYMPINLDRNIDVGTVEVITYALFRAVFGKGVSIPIKREGMMDMDVVVRGKDVILNTNQFFFVVPDLAVWRIIYSHKGVPVMELGRGVNKGLKIHRLQAIRLVLELWKGSIKNQREKARLLAAPPPKEEEGAQ
ncbi:MAG TPA: hypothetical protein VMW85_07050 [Methanomassiliicoccales archaeon]|nr:hypothetical protein [Methanomassiliicoccales archaeon]